MPGSQHDYLRVYYTVRGAKDGVICALIHG